MIIGAGNVGSTIACSILIRGSVDQICIIDIDIKKCDDEVETFNNRLAYVQSSQIKRGTYADCTSAEIIIITAGEKPKQNKCRIELIEKNISILKKIISQIVSVLKPGNTPPILLIISNPVDILTYFATKFSGFPPSRIIGSGTTLDSARLRYEIARNCKINVQNIHGYVLGAQGDTEVIAWSIVRIGSVSLQDHCHYCPHKCDSCIFEKIESEVKNNSYNLRENDGFSNFGIGIAVSRLIEAILQDQNIILPVSTVLMGENHLNGVALSLPCIVNSKGIRQILELTLNSSEIEKLNKNSFELKKIISQVEQNIVLDV